MGLRSAGECGCWSAGVCGDFAARDGDAAQADAGAPDGVGASRKLR